MSRDNVELVCGFATFVMVTAMTVALLLAGFGQWERTLALLGVAVAAALVVALTVWGASSSSD